MSNIPLRGGKEIDLLAINPYTGERFHVESRVSTSRSFKLSMKDTYTTKGKPQRRGLDYFIKQKFYHPMVVKGIKEIFGIIGNVDYTRILVIWGFQMIRL